MFKELKEQFALPKVDLADYSPLTLAYIGDCVYELVIRTNLVFEANAPVNKLNRRGSDLAKAATQAAMAEALMEELTEEEAAVYRRGKNANSHTKAKNASASDYRKATAFEALLGYLYMTEQHDRVMELIRLGWDRTGAHEVSKTE